MSTSIDAMMRVMNWLLCQSHNVLVKYMNDHAINSPEHAEYWACAYVDELCYKEITPVSARAMHDYIQECFTVAGFCFEHAGREFDDRDVLDQIFAAWSAEMDESFVSFDERIGWHSVTPDNWRTTGPRPKRSFKGGVLYRAHKA